MEKRLVKLKETLLLSTAIADACIAAEPYIKVPSPHELPYKVKTFFCCLFGVLVFDLALEDTTFKRPGAPWAGDTLGFFGWFSQRSVHVDR